MSAITARNARQSGGAPMPPLREDGSLHPLAMFYDGNALVAYGDSPAELLDVLIDGYRDLGEIGGLEARKRFAVDTQPVLQAVLHAAGERNGTAISAEEEDILAGPRHVPPTVRLWSCEVPLVLVDVFYAPFTELPAPASTPHDVTDPDNLVWLRPSTEWDFLVSLDRAGVIQLQQSLS